MSEASQRRLRLPLLGISLPTNEQDETMGRADQRLRVRCLCFAEAHKPDQDHYRSGTLPFAL